MVRRCGGAAMYKSRSQLKLIINYKVPSEKSAEEVQRVQAVLQVNRILKAIKILPLASNLLSLTGECGAVRKRVIF